MAQLSKKITYPLAVIILILLIVGGIIVHKKRAAKLAHTPTEMIAPWALHVEPVTKDSVDQGFPALAMITTRQPVTIMARITGRILAMGPREGVAVKKGDLLVRIDTRAMEKKIQSLQAQLVAARAEATRTGHELKREEKLFRDGGSSATAVDSRRTAAVTARQKAASLEHQIAALEVEKGYGVIKSPVNGIIAARLAEPGDMCVPGHALNKITASGGALVRVELPQSILHQVRPGAPVVLSYGDQQMTVPCRSAAFFPPSTPGRWATWRRMLMLFPLIWPAVPALMRDSFCAGSLTGSGCPTAACSVVRVIRSVVFSQLFTRRKKRKKTF